MADVLPETQVQLEALATAHEAIEASCLATEAICHELAALREALTLELGKLRKELKKR